MKIKCFLVSFRLCVESRAAKVKGALKQAAPVAEAAAAAVTPAAAPAASAASDDDDDEDLFGFGIYF